MVANVDFHAGMKVMDFGAGTGLVCGHVAGLVGHVLAVDVSPAMLARLRAKPELQGKVDTLCQNILEQPIDEKFDVIVSAMAMHHVQDIDAMLASFAAHLNIGGQVALADLEAEDGTFHPADIEGVYHHGFVPGELQTKIEMAGFSDVALTTAYTIFKAGKTFPILLLTAKKSA